MGNRAVITTLENYKNDGIGIYVHWGGDRTNVQRWLDTCRDRGYRRPEEDCYGWAYLCHVICESFEDGLSVGIDKVNKLDTNNFDNGTYFIKDWEIVDQINL